MRNLRPILHKIHSLPKKVFLLGLCVGSFFWAQGQSISNNRFTVQVNPNDMGPCGGANDEMTRVQVTANDDTVSNFEIRFDLTPTPGITYTGNFTVDTANSNVDYTVTSTGTDPAKPKFRVSRSGMPGSNWNTGHKVVFSLEKTASCEAVNFSYNGGTFKDQHAIFYDDINGPDSLASGSNINSYDLLSALLTLPNYTNTNAALGQTVTRNVEVANSGNGNIGDFIHYVKVGASLSSYSLSFNGTALTPSNFDAGTDSYTYDIGSAIISQVGNNDTRFGNYNNGASSESITFQESFTVDSCNATSVSHKPTWGCSPTDICQDLAPTSASVIADNEIVPLSVFKPSSLNPTNTELCPTVGTTYTTRIGNNSTTNIAYNVEINTGFGERGKTMNTVNELVGNDRPGLTKSVSNFRFAGNGSLSPQPQQRANTVAAPGTVGNGSYFIPKDYFTSDPDGIGGLEDLDGDGFWDDLAPQASTDLSYDYFNKADSLACGATDAIYITTTRLVTDVYAQNQCNVFSPTKGLFVNDSYFKRKASAFTAPTDVYDGTPFTIRIEGALQIGIFNPPSCEGGAMFGSEPNTWWTVRLSVPPGIKLAPGSPSEFSQPQPTLIQYVTRNLSGGNTFDMPVDFPLVLDCAGYSGAQNFNITYTTSYRCGTDASNPCFQQDMHCGTITGMRSQCPVVCDGPVITSFSAQRETAGWTDDTKTAKVVLDPDQHNLNTYMAKDEMVLRTTAKMTAPGDLSNLLFRLNYETNSAVGGPDIIGFQDGTITINDVSSGTSQTIDLTGNPQVTTNGAKTKHYMDFDLSGYTDAIGPTYAYGQNDEVELELHFLFKEDFNASELLELKNFYGSFRDGNGTTCNIIGDRVFYFKNDVELFFAGPPSTSGCKSVSVLAYINSRSVQQGDQYPGEFRPPFEFESLSLEIPAGAEFSGNVDSSFPGSPSTDNGGLVATVSNGSVVVTRGSTFKDGDQADAPFYQFSFEMRGSSSSAPATTFNATANYKEFAYADLPNNVSDNNYLQTFKFEQPVHSFTTLNTIVSGNKKTSFFEVDLCMDSNTDIDFNWIQIENGNDFTVINAYEVQGANQISLDFTEAAGKTWIKAGKLKGKNGGNSCKKIRFEIQALVCNTFTFTAAHAWGCAGYPSDFSMAAYIDPLDFTLEVQEGILQMQINEPTNGPTKDMCEAFELDIVFRNAGPGDIIDPLLTFEIPGNSTGISVDRIEIAYPRGTVPEPVSSNQVGNTVTINMMEHPTVIDHGGIHGALSQGGNPDGNIADVQVFLKPECTFTSNATIAFTGFGNTNCGKPVDGNGSRVVSDPVIITGAEASYSTFNNLQLPNGRLFVGCKIETLSVSTRISQSGPTKNADFVRITLPDGLTFIPGSLRPISLQLVTFGSVSVQDNHEEIILNMPNGAVNGDRITYEFDVAPKNTTNSCTPSARIDVSNYVLSDELICRGTSCGTTDILVGNTFEDISITKAVLAGSSFASSAGYTPDGNGNYDYNIAFGIENTGTEELPAGAVYDIYCADLLGSKIGSSLFSGSVSRPIAPGNSLDESISFKTTDFCGLDSNILVEFVPADTNCHCNGFALVIGTIAESADLSLDKGVSATSNPQPQTGETLVFELTLANAGPNAANNIAIEDIVPIGYTVDTGSISNGGTLNGSTLSWSIASLDIGTDVTLSYEVTINEATEQVGEYTNMAQVTAVDKLDPDSQPDNYDPDRAREDDEAIYSLVWPDVDIALLKSVDKERVQVGETVVFTVTATNDSAFDATTIDIEDTLPLGFSLRSVSTDVGTYDETTSIWQISSLPAGETAVLTMMVTVTKVVDYTNVATLINLDQTDINDTNDKAEASINVDCIVIYNAVSANGDGANDVFLIECIQNYPNNNLQIFNRWGSKVYGATGYDNSWTGHSEGRATIGLPNKLPVGTYFYILNFGDGETPSRTGWLYLTR